MGNPFLSGYINVSPPPSGFFFPYPSPSYGSQSMGKKKKEEMCIVKYTNLGTNGLASADRNNKATLLLTAPPHTTKSSAKDSSQLTVKLLFTSM